MKNGIQKIWVGVALSVGLAGCGAVAPLWSKFVDPFAYTAHTYTSHDGNSVYVVKSSFGDNPASIEHYGLDGTLISSIPLQDADGNLDVSSIRADDNDNIYLLNGNNLAYFSPENGEIWKGFPATALAANEQVFFLEAYLNSANELVFAASIKQTQPDNSVTTRFAVGSITPGGQLDQWYPLQDVDSIRFLNGIKNGDFFAVVTYTHAHADTTGQNSRLITFDNNLTQQSAVDFSGLFSNPAALKHRLITLYNEGTNSKQVVVSPDGTLTPVNFFSQTSSIVAGHNSFYQIYSAGNGITSQTICNYSYSMQKNWCRNSSVTDADASLLHAEVNADDELEISLSSKNFSVVGPGANGTIIGRNNYKYGHQIFAADGSTRLTATESVYSEIGPLQVGSLNNNAFVSIQNYQAGVCKLYDVTFLPGDKVFSVTRYCHGGQNDTANSQLQLSMWGTSTSQ